MGAVLFSLDTNLVKAIRSVLSLNVFVETGTFKGDTIENVKEYFTEIHSVELSEEYYNFCKERFKNNSVVKLYLDNSADFLSKIQTSLSKKSVLYWLDAHWCVADKAAGEKSQCPLLDEIKAIKSLNKKSVILIDDARLFLSPPPAPHEISQWPDFESVLKALKKISGNHQIMIFNDTILFYPEKIKDTVDDYTYNNSIDWLTVLHKTKDYDNLRNQFDELLLQLKEKESTVFSLSYDLNKKDKKIFLLSDELKEKEKEITFLSQSLNIIKRRLSSPFWGAITLFQHNFPGVWNYLYKQKQIFDSRREENKKLYPLSFFTPRLGKLHHHRPIPLTISKEYYFEKLKTEPLKISIVTPSFNQGMFLKKTIESVLAQDYNNLEYIIHDSCSTDATSVVLKNINDERIKCYIEKDKGQADAINKGFSKSSGEIMAWLNSDDIYLPGTFNYIVNYLNEHPEVGVVYGNRILIDTDDLEIGRWVLPPHDKKVLYWADFIPQETLFWRREIWEKIGGKLDDQFNFALDWDLLLRFQEAGAKIVRVPRFIAAFRVHPNQKTSAQIQTLGNNEMEIIREKYLKQKINQAIIQKNIFYYLMKSEVYRRLNLYR